MEEIVPIIFIYDLFGLFEVYFEFYKTVSEEEKRDLKLVISYLHPIFLIEELDGSLEKSVSTLRGQERLNCVRRFYGIFFNENLN